MLSSCSWLALRLNIVKREYPLGSYILMTLKRKLFLSESVSYTELMTNHIQNIMYMYGFNGAFDLVF